MLVTMGQDLHYQRHTAFRSGVPAKAGNHGKLRARNFAPEFFGL